MEINKISFNETVVTTRGSIIQLIIATTNPLPICWCVFWFMEGKGLISINSIQNKIPYFLLFLDLHTQKRRKILPIGGSFCNKRQLFARVGIWTDESSWSKSKKIVLTKKVNTCLIKRTVPLRIDSRPDDCLGKIDLNQTKPVMLSLLIHIYPKSISLINIQNTLVTPKNIEIP